MNRGHSVAHKILSFLASIICFLSDCNSLHPFLCAVNYSCVVINNVLFVAIGMCRFTSYKLNCFNITSYSNVFKASTILMFRIFLSITKFTNRANIIVIKAANTKLKGYISLPNITISTSAV